MCFSSNAKEKQWTEIMVPDVRTSIVPTGKVTEVAMQFILKCLLLVGEVPASGSDRQAVLVISPGLWIRMITCSTSGSSAFSLSFAENAHLGELLCFP